MIYVHIGAGAGDLDAGAHFRDGFSEFVKQSDDSEKKYTLWRQIHPTFQN